MRFFDWELVAIFGVSIALGYLASLVNVPLAWMLAPMAAGVLYAILRRPRKLPKQFRDVSQVVLGVAAGLGFPAETLQILGSNLVELSVIVVITIAVCMANGWMLYRWAGIDKASGFLGMVPGAAATMVAMSEDLGADARMVAVLQYLRVLMVAFLAPVLIDLLFPGARAGLAAAAPAGEPAVTLLPHWAGLPVLALGGLAGAWLGIRSRLPSGIFLGPMIITMVLTWTKVIYPAMPPILFNGALVALGMGIGVQFDWPIVRQLKRAALIEFVQVLGLVAISLGLGYLLSVSTGIDIVTAILGTFPGAMEAQIATAVTSGANAPLVAAMHLFRFLIAIMTGPWVAQKLTGYKPI